MYAKIKIQSLLASINVIECLLAQKLPQSLQVIKQNNRLAAAPLNACASLVVEQCFISFYIVWYFSSARY